MMKERRSLPEIPSLAQKVSRPWCFWPFDTCLGCAIAANARTAHNPTTRAWTLSGAMLWLWVVYLAG